LPALCRRSRSFGWKATRAAQIRAKFPAADANRSKPRWSAVIELYFDDYDSMQRAWNSPQGKLATDDLEAFADLSLSSWSVVEEILK
jgi:hypothetical protein